MFGLALSTKALQGPWMRIYNSEEDGLSFNRWRPGGVCWVGGVVHVSCHLK